MEPGRIVIQFPSNHDGKFGQIVRLETDYPYQELFALGEMLESRGVHTGIRAPDGRRLLDPVRALAQRFSRVA